jgi:hypothetical protein
MENIMNIDVKVSEETTHSTVVFTQRLLGPVAEAADFLSDKIRFMRWKSAQKTLGIAEEIVLRRGIKINEVPVKFLVPFLEKCSLEDEESELVKKWAELLVTAIADYNHRLISYADILAQLGPEEVHLLEAMWANTDPLIMGEVGNILEIYGKSSAYDREIRSELHTSKTNNDTNVDQQGRYTLMTMCSIKNLNNHPLTFQTGMYMFENSIFGLERLGLTKVVSDLDRKDAMNDYFALKAMLTPLGYSFVKACMGLTAR